MSNNSNRKQIAQGGLEYLITYGWALVMIATIIGVLAITATGVSKDVCPNFRGSFMTLTCEKIYTDGDKLELILRNSTGQKITLNPFTDICFDGKCGYVVVWKGGVKYEMQKIVILPGETVRIEALGTALANTTTITYEEAGTGMVRTIASGLSTSAPRGVEINNNGIDDDGDGLIDCQDPDVPIDPAYGVRICTYTFALSNVDITLPYRGTTAPVTTNDQDVCIGSGSYYYYTQAAAGTAYETYQSNVNLKTGDCMDNPCSPYLYVLKFGNVPPKVYCSGGETSAPWYILKSVKLTTTVDDPKGIILRYNGATTSICYKEPQKNYHQLVGWQRYPDGSTGTAIPLTAKSVFTRTTFTTEASPNDCVTANWPNSRAVAVDIFACKKSSTAGSVDNPITIRISQAKFELKLQYKALQACPPSPAIDCRTISCQYS